MTAELSESRIVVQRTVERVYRSPQEALASDETARQTLRIFLHRYVGSRGHGPGDADLPRVERTSEAGETGAFSQEMFTGYGGLGELVHIRVDPKLASTGEGYFVALANIHTGEADEPQIRLVQRFRDAAMRYQTLIYLEDERCESWPVEYQPMIHFVQDSFRFTYKAGLGQGESLLRPIAPLIEALPGMPASIPSPRTAPEPIGRRALELVRPA
jgi:hypothetical protein